MRRSLLALVLQVGTAAAAAAIAGSAGQLAISIDRTTEDGSEILLATVARGGQPVAGATVAFRVERTFGTLRLGEDVTLDDGTAAAPFPTGLPGGPGGELRVRAEIVDPPGLAGAVATAELPAAAAAAPVVEDEPAGVPLHRRLLARALGDRLVRLETTGQLIDPDANPRALWAPRAPLALLLTLALLLGGVWLTYGTVVLELFKIRKEQRTASGTYSPARPVRRRLFLLIVGFGWLGLSAVAVEWAGAQAVATSWEAPARAARKVNLVPGDAAALATGKALYGEHCLSCHGTKGRGDGPTAKDLERPAGNLADPKMWQQSDGELFWKTSEGNKPMPSFSQILTEEQRWQVVHYMRTLAPRPAGAQRKN